MIAIKDHYDFSDSEYNALLSDGVSIENLFKAMKFFDTLGTKKPITYVNLFYYVDLKGDFNKKPPFPHRKIALALFEKLSIQQKLSVAEYIEDSENDFVVDEVEVEEADEDDDNYEPEIEDKWGF